MATDLGSYSQWSKDLRIVRMYRPRYHANPVIAATRTEFPRLNPALSLRSAWSSASRLQHAFFVLSGVLLMSLRTLQKNPILTTLSTKRVMQYTDLIDSHRAAHSQQLDTVGEMEASFDALGEGGFYSWQNRTLSCFYRNENGTISIVTCREGGTLRMPWNALAKW